VTLNVSLISFDQTGLGEGGSYFSFDSEAAYSGQLAAKVIDTYFPDLDIGSAAGVAALNLMDDDGFADQVFTDDAVLASSIGSQSALDILSITDMIL